MLPPSKLTPFDAIDRKMEDRYNTHLILLYFRCQFDCISIWNKITVSWNIFLILDPRRRAHARPRHRACARALLTVLVLILAIVLDLLTVYECVHIEKIDIFYL